MNFSMVVINGKLKRNFLVSRGLRQGDYFFYFLYVLAVDEPSRLIERAKRFDLVEGLNVGKNSILVSYLQFVDNTIFFSYSDEDKFDNLVKVIEFFYYVYLLLINLFKSCILVINCVEDKVVASANSFGYEFGTWPLKYLGMPLERNLRIAFFFVTD